MKNLNTLSLEELWQLFPIQLVQSSTKNWNQLYQNELLCLKKILPDTVIIDHIGSTAIKGIWTKPIIDILIQANTNDLKTIKQILFDHDYLCMQESDNAISFNKGYTPAGFASEVFHLHIKPKGCCDEIYFRDYLNCHPNIAKEYEQLKLSLWKSYEFNRDEYTRQKTDFVTKHTVLAKETVQDIELIIDRLPKPIQSLFWNIRLLVIDSFSHHPNLNLNERLWAKLPSYYVNDQFIRIIPFKDHLNIEATAIIDHLKSLDKYKITPKGMLQIYPNQTIPTDLLITIFQQTLHH